MSMSEKRLQEHTRRKFRTAIRNISMTLEFHTGCTATDIAEGVLNKESSWRIDHEREIQYLDWIKQLMDTDSARCPVCGTHHAEKITDPIHELVEPEIWRKHLYDVRMIAQYLEELGYNVFDVRILPAAQAPDFLSKEDLPVIQVSMVPLAP